MPASLVSEISRSNIDGQHAPDLLWWELLMQQKTDNKTWKSRVDDAVKEIASTIIGQSHNDSDNLVQAVAVGTIASRMQNLLKSDSSLAKGTDKEIWSTLKDQIFEPILRDNNAASAASKKTNWTSGQVFQSDNPSIPSSREALDSISVQVESNLSEQPRSEKLNPIKNKHRQKLHTESPLEEQMEDKRSPYKDASTLSSNENVEPESVEIGSATESHPEISIASLGLSEEPEPYRNHHETPRDGRNGKTQKSRADTNLPSTSNNGSRINSRKRRFKHLYSTSQDHDTDIDQSEEDEDGDQDERVIATSQSNSNRRRSLAKRIKTTITKESHVSPITRSLHTRTMEDSSDTVETGSSNTSLSWQILQDRLNEDCSPIITSKVGIALKEHLTRDFWQSHKESQPQATGHAYAFPLLLLSERSIELLLEQWKACGERNSVALVTRVQHRSDEINEDIIELIRASTAYALNVGKTLQAQICYWHSLWSIQKAKKSYDAHILNVSKDSQYEKPLLEALRQINQDRKAALPKYSRLPLTLDGGITSALRKFLSEIYQEHGIAEHIADKTRNRQAKAISTIVDQLGIGALALSGVPEFTLGLNVVSLPTLEETLKLVNGYPEIRNLLQALETHFVTPIIERRVPRQEKLTEIKVKILAEKQAVHSENNGADEMSGL